MRSTALMAGMILTVAWCGTSTAETVHVFAAGASQSVVQDGSEPFARASGHRVRFEADTVGALRDRVLAGERPDVVILTRAAVDRLASAGLLAPDGRQPVGAIRFGFAVPRGAPVPDVSTPEALRAALLAAPSIAYGSPERGATAGTHFERILRELGLLDELRPRLRVMPFGADAVTAVAEGRAAFAVSQASEIVHVAGVQLVGELPQPFRLSTPYEAALIRDTPAGRAFLAFLAGQDARALFRDAGFLP